MKPYFRYKKLSLSVLLMLVSGCAGRPVIDVPVDYNDACEQYRTPLRVAEQEQRDFMSKVMATAMLTGIGSGFLCSEAAKGSTGACVGTGIAVATTTLVGGYLMAKQKQSQNQAQLMSAIDNDSSIFGQQLGGLGLAAQGLNQCRQRQIKAVTDGYQAHKISKESAKAELKKIETKITGDQQLINAFMDEMHKRTDMQIEAHAAAENITKDQYLSTLETGYNDPYQNKAAGSEPAVPRRLPKTVAMAPQTLFASTETNLRSKPSTRGKIIATIDRGAELTVNGKAGEWYAATYKNKKVFVSMSLLSATPPKTQVASLEYKNMRGKDATQKVVNLHSNVQKQVSDSSAESARALEQAKLLVG